MLERTYIIPLRKEWLKVPKYKRAKKAVIGVRRFLKRHMRVPVENIKIGKALNEELWKHGIKNPPSRIKINIAKDDNNIIKAELFGHKFVESKPILKEEKEKTKEELQKPEEKQPKIEEITLKRKKESIEKKVKEVVKNKTKDKAVKKGEEKIKEELKKLEEQTEKLSAKE